MPNIIDARIAHYTRKVTEWNKTLGKGPSPIRGLRRHKRLLDYKAAMHKQTEKEAPEWITRPYLKS